MKKVCSILLSTGLILGMSTGVSDTSHAATKIVKYKNCKALNKVFPGGVAQAKNVKNKGGKTKYKPFVSKALYDKNKGLDRDKDKIACER
ncbi:excalibur calcium-binding domain-containing protein [Gottfriedia acidiceleris]|uniref:excalibur calcium-binding domain-containing protein n=1 Tax=Gottfriedia acidiceleris TaxID=371036 RepID=UPI0030007AF7